MRKKIHFILFLIQMGVENAFRNLAATKTLNRHCGSKIWSFSSVKLNLFDCCLKYSCYFSVCLNRIWTVVFSVQVSYAFYLFFVIVMYLLESGPGTDIKTNTFCPYGIWWHWSKSLMSLKWHSIGRSAPFYTDRTQANQTVHHGSTLGA